MSIYDKHEWEKYERIEKQISSEPLNVDSLLGCTLNRNWIISIVIEVNRNCSLYESQLIEFPNFEIKNEEKVTSSWAIPREENFGFHKKFHSSCEMIASDQWFVTPSQDARFLPKLLESSWIENFSQLFLVWAKYMKNVWSKGYHWSWIEYWDQILSFILTSDIIYRLSVEANERSHRVAEEQRIPALTVVAWC